MCVCLILALPVGAGQALVLRLGLGRGLLDPAQGLVDAPGQRVGRVGEAVLGLALLLLGPGPHLLQPDTLPDLGQDVAAVVVVRVGGQDAELGLAQVEAAPLEGGQDLVHGGARWGTQGGGG